MPRALSIVLSLSLVSAAFAGCFSAAEATDSSAGGAAGQGTGGGAGEGTGGGAGDGTGGGAGDGTGGGGTAGNGAGGSAGAAANADGLPCDVHDVLVAYCQSCHGSPPTSAAPVSLVTYADLTAPSKLDPSKSEAQVSLERMQNASSPMPPAPAPAVDAAGIAAMQAWVAAGTPMTSCASDAGVDVVVPPSDAGDPYGTPTVCSSNSTWFFGNSLNDFMNPGLACNTCHAQQGKKIFSIAGTVYKTAHEPDECIGLAGPTVEITGHDGVVISLNTNLSGNFDSTQPVALPYTAKVKWNGLERSMATPQSDGNCNSCHTLTGANSAPGRIMAP